MRRTSKVAESSNRFSKVLSQGRLDDETGDKPKPLARSKRVKTEVFLTSAPAPEGMRSLSQKLIFHPETYWIFAWDMVLILLIVYQAFSVPYIICFDVRIQGEVGYFEFISNVIFLLDIGTSHAVVNFNTAYFTKGVFVTNRILIARNYLRFWFWSDALSSFPYFWISGDFFQDSQDNVSNSVSSSAPRLVQMIRIMRFLRILRLIRLAKLKRILIKIEDFIASNTIADMFVCGRLMFLIFFFAHWIACWSYYVSAGETDSNTQTWVSVQETKPQNDMYSLYITSLYWAFTTMSTVGFGDVVPYSTNEKLYVTFAMIVACGTFAYTVGSIGNLVSKNNAESREFREQVLSVNRYMRKKELPKNLQFRVRRYLEYLWENKKKNYLNEKEILKLLSEPLRDEIYDHVHGVVIKSCPVFENYEPHFISQLSKQLETETFAPADIIFEQGEVSTRMYFLQHGKVDVFHHPTNSTFRILGSKQFFGEIAFMTESPRCASVRCMDFVDLFSLERSALEQIMEKFPGTKEMVELVVRKCASGDLSALQVRCYVCKELGHTATKCSRIILNYNHDRSKQKWLESRKGHSRYVNPYLDIPSHVRREKTQVKQVYTSRNVVGMPRVSEDLYPSRPHIQNLLKSYVEDMTATHIQSNSTVVTTKEQLKIASPERQRKPRFSILLRDEDVGMALVDERRGPTFNKGLIRKNQSIPVVEIESCEGPDRGLSNDVSAFSDDSEKPLFLSKVYEENSMLSRGMKMENEGAGNESKDLGDQSQADLSLLQFEIGEEFFIPNFIGPSTPTVCSLS